MKAEYFTAHSRELESALAQEPTLISSAPIIDEDASVLPLLEYEYRMVNEEAIRVTEEESSANFVLKAKVRKLGRLPPQVTPDFALNTPHEQLKYYLLLRMVTFERESRHNPASFIFVHSTSTRASRWILSCEFRDLSLR